LFLVGAVVVVGIYIVCLFEMLGSSNYEEEEKKLKSRKKKICVTELGESLILAENFKRCENRWSIEWHLDRTVWRMFEYFIPINLEIIRFSSYPFDK